MSLESKELQAFVEEARRMPGYGMRLSEVVDGKLPSRIWVDACVLTGDVALSAVLAGTTTDAELPERLQTAYALAYRDEHAEQSLSEFLQSHAGDPQALQGIASTLKGKTYEIAYVEHLNAGALPAGQVAQLATSSTQEGYDIEIVGEGGEVLDRINTKATASGDYVREHLDRFPGIDAVTTVEAAAELSDREVVAFGSVEDIQESAAHVFETQSGQLGVLGSVPWISMGILGLEAWRQAYVRRAPSRVVLENTARRGLWLGLGTVFSKSGTALLGGPVGGIAAVLVFTGLRQRCSSADVQLALLNGYGEHMRSVRAGLLGEAPAHGAESA